MKFAPLTSAGVLNIIITNVFNSDEPIPIYDTLDTGGVDDTRYLLVTYSTPILSKNIKFW